MSHAAYGERSPMGTHTWTQNRVNSLYTVGNPPPWWDATGVAKLAITVDSPSGAGDILQRTEIWARAGAYALGNFGTLDQPWELWSPTIKLLGEVYPIGSTTVPDPDSQGTAPGVITAGLDVDAAAFDPFHAKGGMVSFSTRGYQTSRGERGPAKYGAGHPQLRVGMNVAGVSSPLYAGFLDSWWNIHVRTLWWTP